MDLQSFASAEDSILLESCVSNTRNVEVVSQVAEPDHQEEERRIEETMGRIEEETPDHNKEEMIKASMSHG
ncbi:unnamed protein product, partial [Citrullus colocynthis]